MRSYTATTVVAILALTLLFAATANFALASGPSSGYVQYKVNVSSQQNSMLPTSSATVNEIVEPTSQSGIVNLTLSVSSSLGNFSYSRDVNSTSLPEIFPYLSGLTNQSFSYQFQGMSISANLVNTGQVSVNFNGTNYQGTKYLISFSAANATKGILFSGDGVITSMPSGLIENIQLSLNQTASLSVTLLSTNLSLDPPTSSINPLGASLLGIAVLAAVAVAAPTIFKKANENKHRNQTQENKSKNPQETDKKQENEDEKKPYWVD